MDRGFSDKVGSAYVLESEDDSGSVHPGIRAMPVNPTQALRVE
jgi:hypothetical protein